LLLAMTAGGAAANVTIDAEALQRIVGVRVVVGIVAVDFGQRDLRFVYCVAFFFAFFCGILIWFVDVVCSDGFVDELEDDLLAETFERGTRLEDGCGSISRVFGGDIGGDVGGDGMEGVVHAGDGDDEEEEEGAI
jgi:hypothetical protein